MVGGMVQCRRKFLLSRESLPLEVLTAINLLCSLCCLLFVPNLYGRVVCLLSTTIQSLVPWALYERPKTLPWSNNMNQCVPHYNYEGLRNRSRAIVENRAIRSIYGCTYNTSPYFDGPFVGPTE